MKIFPLIRPIMLMAILSSSAIARLSDEDLAKKRGGWYPTGIPVIAYSTDTGFGYGPALFLYDNGGKEGPHFADSPYEKQFILEYFTTTRDLDYYLLSADIPHLAGTDFRIRSRAIYDDNTNRNYYGSYDQTRHALPGGTYARYLEMLESAEPAGFGSTSAWFNKYGLRSQNAILQVEHALFGQVKAMGAYYCSRNYVLKYDGRSVPTPDGKKTQGPTLLTINEPGGFGGGWNNLYRIGIAYDTRDFEPAPKSGWFADLTGEYSGRPAGSDFDFSRLTMAVRNFTTIVHGLVAATRTSYSATDGNPPFFDQATIGYFENRTNALGGGNTLRGYKENRFSGKALAMANMELRWDFYETLFDKERFTFTFVGFGDGGRTYRTASETSFKDWRYAVGGGLRMAWNMATIISASYGQSPEDSNITLSYGHMF